MNNDKELKLNNSQCPECAFRNIMLYQDPLPIRCIRRDILDYRDGCISFPKLVYYVWIDLLKIRKTIRISQ